MFILKIDPAKVLTSEIKKTISQKAKDPDSALLKSLGSLKTSPVLEIIETFPPAPGTLGSPPFVADPNPVVCSDPIPSPLQGDPSNPHAEDLINQAINQYFFWDTGPLVLIKMDLIPMDKIYKALQEVTGLELTDKRKKAVDDFFKFHHDHAGSWLKIKQGGDPQESSTLVQMDETHDGKVDAKDLEKVFTEGKFEPNPIGNPQPSPEELFGEIVDLSNEYIIYAQNLQKFFKEHPLMSVTLMPPPWEKSNKLFEDLAQYTGNPSTPEKVNQVKLFFNSIINGNPSDPNGDGKLDYGDVLTIWGGGNGGGSEPPITKGDINGDGEINQADVQELGIDLYIGDMNGDGKLDMEDYKMLKELIDPPLKPMSHPNPGDLISLNKENNSILKPWPPIMFKKGDLNHDGKIDKSDLDILGKVLKAGDMDNDGKVDKTDFKILNDLVNGPDPLTTIKDLSKGLLDDPYHHLTEIPKLGKALAKYTNTEYDLGKADKLFSFFLGDDQDFDKNGVRDYQDVIAFWKSLDKPTMPWFPKNVNIDFDNDGHNEYAIRDGKIWKLAPPGTLIADIEVDSIPGIDLQKLSDEIKQKFEELQKPGMVIQGSQSIQFDEDINGDGKIDHIEADNGLVL